MKIATRAKNGKTKTVNIKQTLLASLIAPILFGWQLPVEAKAEVNRFVCKGGSTEFFEDGGNAKWGIARTPSFLRCTTPDFEGATVGMDLTGLDNGGAFDILSLVFEDDGSSMTNLSIRFCFRQNKEVITFEKPFSSFHIGKIPNSRFSEVIVKKADFPEPIKQGRANLMRMTMLLKSGGKHHTVVFGRSYIETYRGEFQPKDIITADKGCDALGDCALDYKKQGL